MYWSVTTIFWSLLSMDFFRWAMLCNLSLFLIFSLVCLWPWCQSFLSFLFFSLLLFACPMPSTVWGISFLPFLWSLLFPLLCLPTYSFSPLILVKLRNLKFRSFSLISDKVFFFISSIALLLMSARAWSSWFRILPEMQNAIKQTYYFLLSHCFLTIKDKCFCVE